MKIAHLLTALLLGVSLISVSYAGSGKDDSVRYGEKGSKADKVAEAERLAKDPKTSVERIAKAVADAIKEGASPSDVLSRVLESRDNWTDDQVSFLYKTVVSTTPGMSSSLAQDIKDFIEAGKPTVVPPDASEGVKVLVVIEKSPANTDSVINNVVTDSTGVVDVVPVPPLRDVQPGEPHPVVPTPPVVSSSN